MCCIKKFYDKRHRLKDYTYIIYFYLQSLKPFKTFQKQNDFKNSKIQLIVQNSQDIYSLTGGF